MTDYMVIGGERFYEWEFEELKKTSPDAHRLAVTRGLRVEPCGVATARCQVAQGASVATVPTVALLLPGFFRVRLLRRSLARNQLRHDRRQLVILEGVLA